VNWKTSPSYGRKIARPAAASSSCNRQIRFLLAKMGRLSSETLTFLVVPSHPRNRHPADSRGRQSLRGHVRHDLWNRQHLHDYCDDNCDDWRDLHAHSWSEDRASYYAYRNHQHSTADRQLEGGHCQRQNPFAGNSVLRFSIRMYFEQNREMPHGSTLIVNHFQAAVYGVRRCSHRQRRKKSPGTVERESRPFFLGPTLGPTRPGFRQLFRG